MDSLALVSQIEPNSVKCALQDDSWVNAMHDELHQFERDQVWHLVPKPSHSSLIGTKWIFKNKTNEEGKIIRSKTRLVAKGYNQEFSIDFEESFAHVARLEVIRIPLTFACRHGIKLQQMNVKSAFLNGLIKEDIFVSQPPGFECIDSPNHVYKLDKALYGLK